MLPRLGLTVAKKSRDRPLAILATLYKNFFANLRRWYLRAGTSQISSQLAMCYCVLFFCVLLVCSAAQGVFARIRLNKSPNHDMMSTRSEKIMAMVAKEHRTVNSRVEKNYTFEHVNEIVLKQNSECNNHNNDFGRNNVNNHLELTPPSNCAGSPFDIVSDDTDADPDFCLSSEEELFEHFDTRKNKQKVRRSLFNSNHDEQESIPAVEKTIEKPASIEKKPDGKEKKNFCFYCSKLVCKIGRHLENVHRNEEEIKKFTVLPKGCKERKLIIDALRKKGDFIFNTNPHYREDKNLIVCRRSKSYQNQSPSHFKVCLSCKGYFSKLSLRKHFRQCSQTWRKGERNILVNSRRIHGAIHKKANEKLKKDIFPVMREDDVTRILRYDELAILYGNKMSIKYKSRHHDSMIRSRLRLIGRFLLEIKRINLNITDFASVFQPMNYDSVIKAINNVARLDERTGKYGSPATAFALGTALKVNANTLIFECIKIGDINKKKFVKDFLKLMNEDIGSSINRTVVENQLEYNRQKKIILPTIEDIKLLNNLLATKRRECFNNLRHQFDFHEWKQLASFTLISILVFNRRRPGELERAYISDFSNCQGIEETDIDYFKKLSSKSQSTAKRYVRFKIRGKLARGVPVLLDKELEKYVRLIIDYRKQANVPDDNPYIFGLPGENSNKYLRASKLLRELSTECGAKNSFSLRATQLRKHVATQSVLLNLKQDQVHHLADFLGHDEKIHKDIYCIPIVSRDIAQMSKLLELAQGQASDGDDDSSSSEDANDQMSNFNRDISDESEKMRSFKNQNVTPCSINLNKTERSNILHITPQKNNKSKERNTANKTDIIQRRTWTTPERRRARVLLNKYAGSGSLPSFRECEEFISKYQCLRTRTAMQLKLWVQNQIKKQNSFDLEEKTSSARKYTWTTPEKHAVRHIFEDCITAHKLPTIPECNQAKQQCEALQHRSAEHIKAFINNEISRNKKKKIIC